MQTSPEIAGRPSDRGCAAGIVFALAVEADAFDRLAADRVETRAADLTILEGRVADRRVAWCVSGAGRAAATRAAERLVAGHRPRLLVSAGFAGGLAPSLVRGSVVRPTRVVTATDAATAADSLALLPAGDAAFGQAAPLTIVTVDGIQATGGAKRALADRTGGQLVDMETHAVARVAAAAGLPCAALRVISDDAGQDLPPEVERLARPQPTLRRLGAALAAIGRRPGAAVDLWRLYEHAVIDARTLAAALVELCRTLPA